MESVANAAEGEDEGIEITPEMIEAGCAILFEYDPRFSNEADIVTRIFGAMNTKRARPPEA